jgi:hypothetical protein
MMGVEESIHNNGLGKVDCGDEEESNDDDCMVLLPGEGTVEETSNFEEADESDSDDDRVRDWMRKKKRPRVG